MTYVIFLLVDAFLNEKTDSQQETHGNRSAKPIRVRLILRRERISTLSVLQNQRICYPERPTATHAMETLDETRTPSTTNITRVSIC